MKYAQKVLALLLSLIMILGAVPTNMFAAEAEALTAAGNGSTVILACSDIQDPANSYLFSTGDYTAQTQLLNTIMAQVKTEYPTIGGFFCGGDYNFDVTREGSQYSQNGVNKTYTQQTALERTVQDVAILRNTVKTAFPALTDSDMTLIQGNHDTFCSDLTATGGYDKGAYSVYVINEKDYPSGGTASQSLCQQTADGLRSWLGRQVQAGSGKPVFILSHVPLHYSNRVVFDGDAVYAQLLYDAIEAYGNELNIIFLYGHDHAHGDDDYLGGSSQFLTRGDRITVAQSGSRTGTLEKTLNFTYMNYGFVGYYWNEWGETSGPVNTATDFALTMTTFEINGDRVTIRRWDENGQHILKAAGAASLGLRGVSDPLPPNTATYASPQTVRSPKEPEPETVVFEDAGLGITVKAAASSCLISRKRNVTALLGIGVVDYYAYDFHVEDLVGTAEVTMPAKPYYNKVWHVNGGTLEEIPNAVFNGDSVTFTTDHFSMYASGYEIPLDDGAWYLVRTPASELQPGDQVVMLNSSESVILYPGDNESWSDPYNLKTLYEDEYSGTIDPVQFDDKTYYAYDAHMQQVLTDWGYTLTVSDGMGLMNGNGLFLNLDFKPFNGDFTAFKGTAAGTINADGTVSAVIRRTTYYLTFNPNADDPWYGFIPRSAHDSDYGAEYAQLVFYRIEQFVAPDPGDPTDDDEDIADREATLISLPNFENGIIYTSEPVRPYLYHTETTVSHTTPFTNQSNNVIEFPESFMYGDVAYNLCIRITDLGSDITPLYWGEKTYLNNGYLSLGQYRREAEYSPDWSPAYANEPETDIRWEMWLEDNEGNTVTWIPLTGGIIYIQPRGEYVNVYSNNGTLYTNIPDAGIEYDSSLGRWTTTDNGYNTPDYYVVGKASDEGIVKGTYWKEFTDAGCEMTIGTYSFEGDDIVFTKTAEQTDEENYFDIELAIKAQGEEMTPAIVLMLDVSSSMLDQCSICGLPRDAHEDAYEGANWNGDWMRYSKTHDGIRNHQFTERMAIAEEAAASFLDELRQSTGFNHCYIKLITFGGSIGLNENWLDIMNDTSYGYLVNKINNLNKVSGTNLANAMKTAYAALSGTGLPEGCTTDESYLVIMSDGAPNRTVNSGISPCGDHNEALDSAFKAKWYARWADYPHVEDEIINEDVNAPVYMGPVWYADQIHDLGVEIYSVVLGNSLDFGAKTEVENWRYLIGIGLDNDDYMDSFSDLHSHADTLNELKSFYSDIVSSVYYVKDVVVTDPMADDIEFIYFVDRNGDPISAPEGVVFDDETKVLTWALPNDAVTNKLYYRIRVQNENFTTTAQTQDILTNGTTRACYTVVLKDAEVAKYQDAEIPEVDTYEGTLEFDKLDQFGNALAGVTFTLTMKADDGCLYDPAYYGTGTNNHVWSAAAVSDGNGHVVFTHVPSGHSFILTETVNPYLDTLPTIDCGIIVSYGQTEKIGSDWTDGNIENTVPVFYVVHHAVHVNEAERLDPYYDDFIDVIPMYTLENTDGLFDITLPFVGEGYDHTDFYNGIRDGYLYGGLYDGVRVNTDHDSTVIPENDYDTPDTVSGCGKTLEPEAWHYYYLREVSEDFLMPANYSDQRRQNDTVIERYLLTGIDSDGADNGFYTQYGFLFDLPEGDSITLPTGRKGLIETGATEEIFSVTTAGEDTPYTYDEMHGWLYSFIHVQKVNLETITDYLPTDAFPDTHVTDADYIGILPLDSADIVDAEKDFGPWTFDYSFYAYYVTADGVLVTGDVERYVQMTDGQLNIGAFDRTVPSVTYRVITE